MDVKPTLQASTNAMIHKKATSAGFKVALISPGDLTMIVLICPSNHKFAVPWSMDLFDHPYALCMQCPVRTFVSSVMNQKTNITSPRYTSLCKEINYEVALTSDSHLPMWTCAAKHQFVVSISAIERRRKKGQNPCAACTAIRYGKKNQLDVKSPFNEIVNRHDSIVWQCTKCQALLTGTITYPPVCSLTCKQDSS